MSGRVTEIKLLKRVNLGNYEHEEATITYVPSESQELQAAVNETRNAVYMTLEQEVKAPVEKKVAPKVETPVAKKAVEEKKTPVVKKPNVETAKADAAEAKKAVEASVGESVEEVTEVEGVEETVEETKEEAKPKTRKTKPKAAPYDRENQSHKSLLADFLNKNFPDWQQNRLQKVITATKTLATEGVNFVGDDGIDATFSERLSNLIS